jgi:hypothetical protein
MPTLWERVFGVAARPAPVSIPKGNPITAKRSKVSNLMKPINNAREIQNIRRRLVVAVIKKDIQEAKRILETGVDTNTTDGFGTPILMLVPRVNSMDVNTRNPDEKNAMQLKCIEMFTLLLEKGADINKQDAFGLTTLYSIVVDNSIRKADKLKYIEILLDKGADVNIPCKSGSTVLDFLYLEDTVYINENIKPQNQVSILNVKALLRNKVFSKMVAEGTVPDKIPRIIRQIETRIEEAIPVKMAAAQTAVPDADLKGLQIFKCWRDSDRISLQGAIHRSPLTMAQMTRGAGNKGVHRKGNAAEANIAKYEAFGTQLEGYQNEVNAGYELAQLNANAAEAELEKQIKLGENAEAAAEGDAEGAEAAQVTKAIQNEYAAGAGAGKGGRRSRRHRKMKMRTQKRRSN